MRDYMMPDGTIASPLLKEGALSEADPRFVSGVVWQREQTIIENGGKLWYGFDYKDQVRIKDGKVEA